MKRNHFWAVQYTGGNKTCTMGFPNPKTGRLSLAADVTCFQTKTERDEWVARGHLREAVDKKGLRSMRLGMSTVEFEEMCEWVINGAYLI